MGCFKHFDDRSEYDRFINDGNVFLPNVSLVNNEYHNVFGGEIGESSRPTVHYSKFVPPTVDVGWVCYYNGYNLKLCSPSSYQTVSDAQKIPIGVVVVPSNHINDGTVRICSLTATSTTYEWANPSGLDVSVLTNLTGVTKYDNTDGGTATITNYGFLPSDNFSNNDGAVECQSDSANTSFYFSSALTDSGHSYYGRYIPSPYAKDGSRYDGYFYPNNTNALMDFDGEKNTNILKSLSSTAGTVESPCYSAATYCSTFSQSGYSGIKWYLPACGELAYVVPRLKLINTVLIGLSGSTFASANYWSSSEYSSAYARYVYMNDGYVGHYSKSNKYRVRPFAKVVLSPFCF